MACVYFLVPPLVTHAPRQMWDKTFHVVAYGLFGVLCLRATHGGFRPLRVGPTVLAMLLTLGYGALDELSQASTPGRDGSLPDWSADAVGALLALVSLAVIQGRRAKADSTATRGLR